MALNITTLSAAIGTTDTSLLLASVTGITGPNFQTGFDPVKGTGTGPVYLFIEQEWILVLTTPASATVPVNVKRAQLGSCAMPHGASAVVMTGQATDFPGPIPISIKASQDFYPNMIGFSAPLVGANANVAPGYFFHLTGTTIMKSLTAPTVGINAGGLPLDGSQISIVFDGSAAGLTWDATGNIAVAGTSTTAASMVTFTFDQGSGKWHPSRLA
jgi:hypothetical protein